ncbi:hypothetical protein DAPPUDRAFT_224324 [Daphnia pulex]|uniref:Uncharacterized protein n=1 Tax=Daphnia pulex TaxID=6669 RepID=E9GGR3_DAPPU|nr:hypothetical protein DAPPUDRAFT_224324 [Daphnia pulex]|eukprot:EFX81437.1 hypothetical protein DAPPUDRAFT_224324 [Daphnia pulex]
MIQKVVPFLSGGLDVQCPAGPCVSRPFLVVEKSNPISPVTPSLAKSCLPEFVNNVGIDSSKKKKKLTLVRDITNTRAQLYAEQRGRRAFIGLPVAGTLPPSEGWWVGEMASTGTGTMKQQQRRRFSLQTPVNFISKMGRKLSVGNNQHQQPSAAAAAHLSSRSSSVPGSLNHLSDPYAAAGKKKSRWRKSNSFSSVCDSEEELNRQFADFDTYLSGFDDAPAPVRQSLPVPTILLQPADDDDDSDLGEKKPGGRQRSRSETRSPSHFSRFLKFNRRRTSPTNQSPTSPVSQSLEFPVHYERRGSFQSTLGITTPILKCSLEQLPEGVQVHHATRTCSPSPEHFNGPSLSPSALLNYEPDRFRFDSKSTTAIVRDRSATFSSTDGMDRRNPSLELVPRGTVQRERSVSFSATQAGGGGGGGSTSSSSSSSRTPPDDRMTKKRRSLSHLFWPPSALFGRSSLQAESAHTHSASQPRAAVSAFLRALDSLG